MSLGAIWVDGGLQVHSSLLNVALHDWKFHTARGLGCRFESYLRSFPFNLLDFRRGSHKLDIAKICFRRAGDVVATVSSRNDFQNDIPKPRRSGTAAR
jgi:hypothetical protein